MRPNTPQQGSCLGASFYRIRHAHIRRLKRLHSPSALGFRVWGSCRLLMDYLKTLGLTAGLKVMDVGCGWGLAGIFCAHELKAKVTCVDSDPEVFEYLQRWSPFVGQVGGGIKVDSAGHVYAAFCSPRKYALSGV